MSSGRVGAVTGANKGIGFAIGIEPNHVYRTLGAIADGEIL
jgi:hypothetical protein